MKLKLFLLPLAIILSTQIAYASPPQRCPSTASVKSFATSPDVTFRYVREGLNGTKIWNAFLENKFDTDHTWDLEIVWLEGRTDAELRANFTNAVNSISYKQGPFVDTPMPGTSGCLYMTITGALVGGVTTSN